MAAKRDRLDDTELELYAAINGLLYLAEHPEACNNPAHARLHAEAVAAAAERLRDEVGAAFCERNVVREIEDLFRYPPPDRAAWLAERCRQQPRRAGRLTAVFGRLDGRLAAGLCPHCDGDDEDTRAVLPVVPGVRACVVHRRMVRPE